MVGSKFVIFGGTNVSGYLTGRLSYFEVNKEKFCAL